MTIQEAYEKYKHLDQCFSDGAWAGGDFKYAIIYDLWKTIKTHATSTAATARTSGGTGRIG